jgi:hypothetical protein
MHIGKTTLNSLRIGRLLTRCSTIEKETSNSRLFWIHTGKGRKIWIRPLSITQEILLLTE